jgi:putative ABC transport system permease protein
VQLLEGVTLAMEQIRAEKLKSFFALLGVIIGVMFLLLVVSIVEGMDRYIREDFSSQIIGINTITLTRTPQVSFNADPAYWRAQQRRPRITYADADAIRDRLEVPTRVAVESGTGGEIVADNGRTVRQVRILGASSEVFQIRDWNPEKGASSRPRSRTAGCRWSCWGGAPPTSSSRTSTRSGARSASAASPTA